MLTDIKINDKTIARLSLAVEYTSLYGRHRDILYFDQFHIWSDADFLPMQMQLKLIGKRAGYKERFCFSKGALIKANDVCDLHTIKNQDFNRHAQHNLSIEPRLGRFYPAAWFNGIIEDNTTKMKPVRIKHIDNEMIQVDFNHALSEYDIDIEIEVFSAYQEFNEKVLNKTGLHQTGSQSRNCMQDLLLGPGMQLRIKNTATDFFSDDPFGRTDTDSDEIFYASPRMVNHLDETALQQVRSLYKELIPKNADILDLMSSMNSHLPESIESNKVTGLGMNREELDANTALDARVIHDLNDDSTLPFADNSFDIVLCTVSVEYLTRPFAVFEEIGRILKPGGKFITTFSNRWFPTKAIRLWPYLHEFERMGLVSEYFINSKLFKQINTRSVRGLSRPKNDRYTMPLSDPVYAVWATKS
jgi:SAM-dependent methyltransferase